MTIGEASTETTTFDLDAALDEALLKLRTEERETAERDAAEKRQRADERIAARQKEIEATLPAYLRDAYRITYVYDNTYDTAHADLVLGGDHWRLWSNGWGWVLRTPDNCTYTHHLQVETPTLAEWMFQQMATWRESKRVEQAEQSERDGATGATSAEPSPRVIAKVSRGAVVELRIDATRYGDFTQSAAYITADGSVTLHRTQTALASYDEYGDETSTKPAIHRFSLDAQEMAALIKAYHEQFTANQESHTDADELPF